ncbi:MAG: hypothetical protein U0N22_04430, partial [Acutalibacter sp.]
VCQFRHTRKKMVSLFIISLFLKIRKRNLRIFYLLFHIKESILSGAGHACGQSRHPDLKKH